MAKKGKKKFTTNARRNFEDVHEEVIIPDAVLSYIVNNYAKQKALSGMPVVVGVSAHTVEAVLQLLIDWGVQNGYVKDGVLTLGE